MDPLSQGALGAIAAGALAPPSKQRWAMLIGWVGGMLADADVLIRSDSDPLLTIEYHRHFTHSLAFIPVGGLVCAALFWLLFRGKHPFKEVYLYSLIGYATAGLLDACTSYGTHLLWPFSDDRVAWSVISIIDPIFSGAILLLVVIGCWKRKPMASRIAWAFALSYLAFGYAQHSRATQVLRALAEERGHVTASRFTVKPSIGNLVLWRGIYEHEGSFYIDALRVGFPRGEPEVYTGDRVEKVDVAALRQNFPPGSAQDRDVERFAFFSDGYVAWHPEERNVLGDARYALLPDSTIPLWGIRIDPDAPHDHAPFLNFRKIAKDDRDRLWTMIVGGL